jgi:CBS domain-containing protein
MARTVRDVMTGDPVCLSPDTTLTEAATVEPDEPVSRAVDLMRERAIRRLPVCEGDRPVGIVSLGDLAQAQDPQSALGDISAAPPNR